VRDIGRVNRACGCSEPRQDKCITWMGK